MDKNEILEKSRLENKSRDPYELEVIQDGFRFGTVVAMVLATVFFAVQIFVGGGSNMGLYAIIFSTHATIFTVKAVKLRRRHEIVLAVISWAAVVLASAMHIYRLVASSAIL